MKTMTKMSRIKLLIALLALIISIKASAQRQALILGYSQVQNVYEDENLKAELVRLSLRITNKTNKTIFIDRRSSFYYYNDDDPICLDETKTGSGKYANIQTLAPKSQTWIASLKNPLYRTYDAGGSYYKGGNGSANYFSEDARVQFMGYVETMRFELANNQTQSCAKIHLTGDESFIKVKVSITYSMDQNFLNSDKDKDLLNFSVSTWVSDMIMSKYYVQEQDKVVRTHAVNVQGRMTNILHVFADSPFEYDEDLSPLDMFILNFSKGKFSVNKFNNVNEDKENNNASRKSKDKQSEEMTSNFEKKSKYKNIFIWEGESTNWVQAMTSSYAKFKEEDGMKPKKALDEAKKFVKNEKKAQTLEP